MKLGKVNFLQSYNYGRLNRPLWITLFNIRSIHESETVSFVVYLIKVDAFPYVSNSAMSKPFRSISRILGWYVQNHDNIENNIFSYPSLLNITSISERHMYTFVKKMY